MTWLTPAEQRADLALAAARFHTELGKAPDLFAYPYGEISQTLRRNVAEAGFTAAFGQHSGAAGALADHLALPRFPLNEPYGALARFRLVANALPLPVEGVTSADTPIATAAATPPTLGLPAAAQPLNLAPLHLFPTPHH